MNRLLISLLIGMTLMVPTLRAEIIAFTAPDGSLVFNDDSGVILQFAPAAWGPNWGWTSIRFDVSERSGDAVAVGKGTLGNGGPAIQYAIQVRKTAPRQVTADFTLAPEQAGNSTLVISGIEFGRAYRGRGKATVLSGGEESQRDIPFGRQPLGTAVTQITAGEGDSAIRLRFSTPTQIQADGVARVILGEGQLSPEPRTVTVTIDLPADVRWYPTAASMPDATAGWYTWQSKNLASDQGVFGMAGWLEAPAGKNGRVKRDGDNLLINGKPAKFWGINNCYASCSPPKELAEQRAKMYAKYGINAVRLHKYADGPGWAGIQSATSFEEFDAAALDRMDYFIAKLKEAGIYTKLSPTFGLALGADDRDAIPYLDEFGQLGNGKEARVRAAHGTIWLGSELQDIQIRQMTKLLAHKNPYTGLTYAEDPAILVIEMYNEDSALFHGTLRQLQTSPTLRKRASEAFSDWLIKRYKNEEGLIAAWGKDALNSFGNERITGESLANRTVAPAGNPWFFDPTNLRTSQAAKLRRMHDTMLFLYEIQNAYYEKYSKAMRAAGYEGEILASNWIAGRAFSHLYNLHSDSLWGMIDRHNYTGGPTSNLSEPGSALLSTGMNQVLSHPFSLSEWVHTTPSEWLVEGPAILGAYGMGLNGWDVSFIFQNRDNGGFSERMGREEWDPTAPPILGVFPAVSRQVLRGDVKESELVVPMNVHVPSMYENKLSFDDEVTAEGDVKEADTDKVPAAALAVARVGVQFTDSYQDTPKFDLSKYTEGNTLVSSTKQLRWTPGDQPASGFITIDTPGTQAVVGFTAGKTHKLANVTITPETRFAAIYVSTIGKEDTDIAKAKQLLVTAIARAQNTNSRRTPQRVLAPGQPPILMEPVKANIQLANRLIKSITLLDHDGLPTKSTLQANGDTFTIDGTKDKTAYYLVELE